MMERGDGIERETLIRRLQETAAAELRGVGNDAPFSLVDFPDHGNVGDSAIAFGTTAYFREHCGAVPSYERFPDREIIQLPQSIHFADPGRVARTARLIARHGKFRLLVRDQGDN